MNPITALVALAAAVFAFKSLPSGKDKRRDGSSEFMPRSDEEPMYGGSDPDDWAGSLKKYSPKLYGHGDRRPDGYIIMRRDDKGERDWRPFSKHIIGSVKDGIRSSVHGVESVLTRRSNWMPTRADEHV